MTMVKITKEEAMLIRKKYPNAKLFTTSKRKPSRARTYYMTEETYLMKALAKMRGE